MTPRVRRGRCAMNKYSITEDGGKSMAITKQQKKKLDSLWSTRIRSKGRCEVCGKDGYLNAHHIVGRRNRALRWDLRNGVCLCPGCHTFKTESAHQDLIWFNDWLKNNKAEDIDYLREKKNEICKPDFDIILEYLTTE